MRRAAWAAVVLCAGIIIAPAANAQVLRVGTLNGSPGQFSSIQAAVNAAGPGDWVLVAPGDYKTTSSSTPAGADDTPAAVLIKTANLHLRGMDRNAVIVDGTKPGSPACSSRGGDQNFGPKGDGGPLGLNGIMVWKANDVAVQNLTACNF